MIPVSDEYKQAIRKDVRSFDIKTILLGGQQYIPQRIETTNSVDLGDLENIFDYSPIFYNYASLEQDSFLLDGSFILPNSSDNKYAEFIGTQENCALTFYYWSYRSSYSGNKMKILFEKGYATSFTISVYDGNHYSQNWTLVEETTYTNDKEEVIVDIPYIDIGYDKKIVITINEWSNNDYPRIKKIMSTDNIIFNNSDIVSMKMLEQTDLRGLDIPSGDFSITVDNYNRQYNVLDDNNILNKLNKTSMINTYLGLNINGTYEYIYIGGYWYSNYKENSNKTIDFNFEGQVARELTRNPVLVNSQLTPEQVAGGYLFGDLSEDRADYIDYQGEFQAQYLPYTSLQEQQQEALVFYNISIRERRKTNYNGVQVFNIAKLNENIENYIISLDNQIRNPSFIKSNKTKTIRFNYYNFGSATEGKTQIYNEKIKFFEVADIYKCSHRIKTTTPIYKPASIDIYYNDTKIVNNSMVVSGTGFENYFAYSLSGYYELLIELKTTDSSKTTGIFRVEVTSYEKIENTIEINNENISNGPIIEINTNTIKTENDMNRIADTIFNYENTYPFEFETEIMGDIRLEVGDKITLQSLDGYHTAIIQSIDTTYNGGLTQIIKGVCSDVLQ